MTVKYVLLGHIYAVYMNTYSLIVMEMYIYVSILSV
jgi:hypothetical protein